MPTAGAPGEPAPIQPAPAPAEELEKLQGTWTIIASERDGEEVRDQKALTWTIASNVIIFRGPAGEGSSILDIRTFYDDLLVLDGFALTLHH